MSFACHRNVASHAYIQRCRIHRPEGLSLCPWVRILTIPETGSRRGLKLIVDMRYKFLVVKLSEGISLSISCIYTLFCLRLWEDEHTTKRQSVSCGRGGRRKLALEEKSLDDFYKCVPHDHPLRLHNSAEYISQVPTAKRSPQHPGLRRPSKMSLRGRIEGGRSSQGDRVHLS
jgi:hypothetical protein